MHIDNHPQKFHAPAALAGVIGHLIDEKQPIFTLRTLCRATGLMPETARTYLSDLEILGAVRSLRSQIAPDTYALVPQRLGLDVLKLGPPYAVAPILTQGRDYYVSYLSAMVLHRMVPWLRPVLYVNRPRYTPNRVLCGVQLVFVQCKPAHFFAEMRVQADPHTEVVVSDPERTLVDGLRQPKYVAGFASVVTGFLARQADLDLEKMVHYAGRLGFESLTRRLGYMFEVCRVAEPRLLQLLQERIQPEGPYMPLDSTLPRRGICCQKWRLHINMSLRAIESAAHLPHREHLELFR